MASSGPGRLPCRHMSGLSKPPILYLCLCHWGGYPWSRLVSSPATHHPGPPFSLLPQLKGPEAGQLPAASRVPGFVTVGNVTSSFLSFRGYKAVFIFLCALEDVAMDTGEGEGKGEGNKWTCTDHLL